MSPKIQDLDNIVRDLQQMNGLDDQAIRARPGSELALMEPVKAPSGWTKFKAALSHLPLLSGLIFLSIQEECIKPATRNP